MNSDDLEKRLQQQTIRKVPATWRQEILDVAKAKSVAQPAFNSQPTSWWRELFWPCRHAWTGMAALWIVMWGINSGLSGGEQNLATSSTAVPAMLQAMKEQRQLLAELIPPSHRQPAEPPRHNQPQPRSERHVEMFIA